MISTSVRKSAERVREGKTFSDSLAETRLIPDLALEMIEVGEASGALSAMLTSVAEFYEEEVSTSLQRTLAWIPIVILGVMAVVVGFILISLYLPHVLPSDGWTGDRSMATHYKQSRLFSASPDDGAEREAARSAWRSVTAVRFVDLREQRIDPELFRSIPAEMMFRYNFVPLEVARNARWSSPWPIPASCS